MAQIADAKKVEEAIKAVAMSGGGANAGVIALCAALLDAGVLSPDAVAEIRDAMVRDINGSPGPFQAKSAIRNAISQRFAAFLPKRE